jgi:hypothetical protein
MDVGVGVAVVVVDGVDDLRRLLRGGRRVEVDQLLATELALQDREVLANGGGVDHPRGDPAGAGRKAS